MDKNSPYLRIIKQFIENTLAYALPVFFQQFIVYPLMADKLGAEANGLFLAAIALNYFVINITVSVLVNVRLLRDSKYEEAGAKGDFNLFLLAFAVINTLVIIGGTFFYAEGEVSASDLLLSVCVILLFVYHDYILVQYRLEHRFRNILINNLLICAGYMVGLAVLYYVIPCWQMVFIVPYLITMVYDLCHTDYIKEPLKKTPLFNDTAKQYLLLLGSTLLSTVVTYGDRLILYPLLDGTSVSVFTSAQLIGKMLQMISTPLASFLLSYLVKRETMQLVVRPKHGLAVAAIIGVLYGGCILVSQPMMHLLYSQWAEQSLAYVPLTAANGITNMFSVLLNVFVLRFCNRKWQIVKGVVYLVTYMLFSFVLLHWFGLRGFAVGNLIASVCELTLLVVILFREKFFIGKSQAVQA